MSSLAPRAIARESSEENTRQSLSKGDYVAILDGSFDGGVLIDEHGVILYANDAAQVLFDFDGSSPSVDCEKHLTFWTYGLDPDVITSDTMQWNRVVQMLEQGISPAEWTITASTFEHNQDFPAVAKLTLLNDRHNPHRHIVMAFLRHIDNHESIKGTSEGLQAPSSSGELNTGSSFKPGGVLKRRQSSQPRLLDGSTEAMITIDKYGNVVSFNQSACEAVDWCDSWAVGKSIMAGAMAADKDDPAMLINEFGQVVNVSESAKQKIPWCKNILTGSHLQDLLLANQAGRSDLEIGGSTKLGSVRPIATLASTKSVGVSDRAVNIANLSAPRSKQSDFIDMVGPGDKPFESEVDDSSDIKVFITEQTESECSNHNDRLQDGTTATSASDAMKRDSIMTAIVEAAVDPLFQINEAGIIQMVNKAAVISFGYDRDELLGKNISLIVGGDHAKSYDKYIQRYLATGDTRTIGQKRELQARRKDGTEFPIELAVVEVDTFNGDERLFCGFIRDLSDIKQKQQIANGILESSLDAMFQTDDNCTIEMVNEAAISIFGWTREDFMGQNIDMIVSAEHAHKHNLYLAGYKATGITELIGVRREMKARKRDGSEFPIELYVVEVKGTGGADSKFCAFLRDLTEVKLKETMVIKRERLVTGILNASLDPMFQINETGIIQTVNRAACNLFGWEKEELLGSNVSIIVGKAHASNHDSYLRRYMETGDAKVIGKRRELPARRKDGSEFIIELSLAEIETNADDDRLFCGYVTDLTNIKAKEAIILKRERLVTGILHASVDPMFQINEKGIIQTVNESAINTFGWNRDDFVGSNISMIVGSAHAPNHDQYLKRYLETGVAQVMGKKRELPARRKDGSEIVVELSLVEIDTDDTERLFCGFIRDLTKQKAFEGELQRRESFTNKIIESSHDALFVVNQDGSITRVNAAAVSMFGKSRADLLDDSILLLLTPEHREWLREEIEIFTTVGIPIAAEQEVEAVHNSGTPFPVSLTMREIQGVEGLVQFACFVTDLSERNQLMAVEIEKTAAEVLLMNVLPEQIATQLLNDPQHIAESHDCAGIMFADIVGFTTMSSTMEPREVVSMLNELFSMFDEVVDRYNLNKIKTIGDCYMVTSVPSQSDDDKAECAYVCHFALDMLVALDDYNSKAEGRNLSLRVGLNVGPVVAGVVGTKRFLYDLWGDAVNTASRMESSGIPGRIQVTTDVVKLLDDLFSFDKRGTIIVKGKGEMETYFLTGRKKPAVPRQTTTGGLTSDTSQTLLFDEDARMTLFESLRVLEGALMSTGSSGENMNHKMTKKRQSLKVLPRIASVSSMDFQASANF